MKKSMGWVLFYCATIAAVLLAAHYGSRAATVMGEGAPIQRTWRLVIDPGHGGEDGGATSPAGLPESGYNLEISLRLNDLLHLLGYETVMVRTTDTAVYTDGTTLAQKKASDLRARARLVNETENALLLSIHQNYYPDSRYDGPQVFYAGTQGSRELAQPLQGALSAALDPDSRRSCKKSAGVYLLEHIHCPGVLIECGFLSNPAEEAKLRSPDYQKKLCCVIAATVASALPDP